MAATKEEKRAQKRKDLVKNILIVFLAVMLVLTFFSGTIQNWSLPEVATAYVQQGSVSPQIRASGVVEADDPYNIEPKETRRIASVSVKVGDEVKQGDVLFVLEGQESEELEAAMKELQELENQYELALFTGDVTDEIITRVRNGQSGTAASYQQRLREVNDAYNNAVAADTQAASDLELLKAEYDVKIGALKPVDVTDITIANANAEAEISKLTTEETNLNTQIAAQDAIINDTTITDPNVKSAAQTKKAQLEGQLAGVVAKKQELQNQMAENKRNADIWTAQYEQQKAALELEYNTKRLELEARKAQTAVSVETAKTTREAAIGNIQSELTLSGKYESLSLAVEKVAKLQEQSLGSEVKSPVDGRVTSINYAAGQTMQANETAAVIQVKGKAMTMKFTVTAEQARSLKQGDVVDPQDAWRYSEFKAQITAIRPDPEDPGNRRQVTISIDSPEVQTGQTVNIRIGESQKNYEMTVPNSAIKEDNNGKFVLIVQQKSSPLRNRYIARRVDVEVLASDDTTTAINAAIEGYEYVITTANANIEPGQEVRLAETGY
ncbi:MAG: HlyD family efflux transporter periplasmic adaptor subunit [Lachnospiraceae bacterium]|nr:HlyD family efflux transporter periplasmic adaptor subunit [Lachnospiraceae bacterium]